MKDNRRLEKSLLLDEVMSRIRITKESYTGAIRAEISDQIDSDLASGKSLEEIAQEMGVELTPLAFGNMPKKRYVDKSKAGREIPDQTAADGENIEEAITQVSFLMDEMRDETRVLFDFDFSQVEGLTSKEISRADIRFIMNLYTYVKWNQKKISPDKKYIAISANKIHRMGGYNTNNSKMNQGQYEAILKRYKRLSTTFISADVTGQFIKKYNAIPEQNVRLIHTRPLLAPLNLLEWKDKRGNITLGQWYALPTSPDEISPLASYINSTLTNGAYLIENKYLALPGRYSDERQSMLEYIICQIKLYQGKKRNSNSITYEDVFSKCGITINNAEMRRKYIKSISEILEHLKATGLIDSYEDRITKAVPGQRGKAPAYKFTFETKTKEKTSKKKPQKY